MFKYRIEVVSDNTKNKKEKGDLLEELCEKVLKIMQYEVENEVRKEGMEVDLIANHKVNKSRVYIECKAQRENISSSIIRQLVGNLAFEGVNEGWLFTTASLGKDSKALKLKAEDGKLDYNLSFYTSEKIIELLLSTNVLFDPNKITFHNNIEISEKITLILSKYGMFWAFPLVEQGSISSIILFNASSGEQVRDQELVGKIAKTDTDFKDYEWISDDLFSLKDEDTHKIEEEVKENIIEVSSGDKWTDYRPSRPEDFVGRDKIIKETFGFLDNIKNKKSKTRLISYSAPSGLGKSSILLKLIDESKKRKYQKKYFIYGVDVRAAISGRYTEYALKECIKSAKQSGFLEGFDEEIIISDINSPFESSSGQKLLDYLESKQKVIILFFDQFEEILSKKELQSLFSNTYKLSNAIDSIKENIALGFAWKTDFLTPADSNAYNMWHNLSDRKINFELPPFNEKDIKKALNLFSKEIKSEINLTLKSYLIDQCQGYPWLLKKLCIHISENLDDVFKVIIDRNLDIKELFEKDLNNLTPAESSCIEKVGLETPVDFYIIAKQFGEEVIQALISKRLILRKGSKLILYWDIFRDYVINKTIPKIYTNYIPKNNYNTFLKVSSIIGDLPEELSYDEFAEKIYFGKKTAVNIMSDLMIFGIILRKNEKVKFLSKSNHDNHKKAYEVMSNHILLKEASEYLLSDSRLSLAEFERIFYNLYNGKAINKKTKDLYIKRFLGWFSALNIIKMEDQQLYINSEVSTNNIAIDLSPSYTPSLKRKTIFQGQTSYEKTKALLELLCEGDLTVEEIKNKKFRNSLYVLNSLDLVETSNGKVRSNVNSKEIDKEIIDSLEANNIMKEVINYHRNNNVIDATCLGDHLGKLLNKNWQDESKKRIGNAMINWHKSYIEIRNKINGSL